MLWLQTHHLDRAVLGAQVAVILCLAYVLFVHNLGATSLWDPDEPRQAIEAREMVERSDYIHPYLNGKPYLEKPPLYPWLIVISAQIRGRLDEFAARIPSALAATLLLIIVFFLGRRFGDRSAGVLSVFILAANFQFLLNARESVMDMTFAMFIGLTIFLAYVAVMRDNRLLFVCAFVPSALAILSKGPAGLIIPAGILLLFLFSQGKARRFVFPLLAGCCLSAGLASVWFVLAGKAYYDEFILHQNLARYMRGFDHIESLLYYFPKLLFNFFPWSCFLPFAIYDAVKRRQWLPLCWFAFTFAFFEFSRSKRAVYLLPAYPAMAILVALYLKEEWQGLLRRGWSNHLVKVFALLITVIPVVAGVVPLAALQEQRMMLGRIVPVTIPLAILTLFGLTFLVTVAKRVPGKSLAALFAYSICLGFLYHSLYMPAVDMHYKSVRRITDVVKSLGGSGPVYTFGFNSPALIYYLGRPVSGIRDVHDIRSVERNGVLIAENKPGRQKQVPPDFSPVRQVRYEKDTYTVFMKNQGAAYHVP